VADNTNLVMRAVKAGTVTYVDSKKIVVDDEEYPLTKCRGPERAHLPKPTVPVVVEGQKGRAWPI